MVRKNHIYEKMDGGKNMSRKSIIHNYRQTYKWNVIKRIIGYNNKMAEGKLKPVSEKELWNMDYNDLKNLESELRIQLGIPRRCRDCRL